MAPRACEDIDRVWSRSVGQVPRASPALVMPAGRLGPHLGRFAASCGPGRPRSSPGTRPTAAPTGFTEAINLLSKMIKPVGHGFRNFPDHRRRLLLHCDVTWKIHRTAKLRGHSPRWVA
jgi:hypothetical protein